MIFVVLLEVATPPTKSRSVRYYSDISSSEDFSSSESEEGEEEVSEDESEHSEPDGWVWLSGNLMGGCG
jgi:type IV secretory pathway TraG/TraD family ATPase VirD4